MKLVSRVAHSSESKNAYKVLVGNSEGKNPLGRYRVFRNTVRKTIVNGLK
jgi:hypothetical protein